MDRTEELLASIQSLPPAPKLLNRLLGELNNIDSDLNKVVELISVDPALTAKLLQVCNSAYYGLTDPVNHVSDAVNRLGFHSVFHIVAVVSGEHLVRPSPASALDGNQLWKHSVTVAFASQLVGKSQGADSALLFTAGLLHDIGKLVLGEIFTKDYARLIHGSHLAGRALVEVERSCFSTDHCTLGARLLERWNFSPLLVNLAAHHHAPEEAAADRRFAACLELADTLAHEVDGVKLLPARNASPALSARETLGVSEDQVERYREGVKKSLPLVETLCSARL
jgi:putative nucleotidyltransferase with HDIG domain